LHKGILCRRDEEMKDFYADKNVLVTGGAGSIGSEIVRKLTKGNPRTIRILDANENGLFQLEERLQDPRLRFLVGDIRDRDRVARAMEDVDVVFHAAALKHVPLCEFNPFEAVKTNVVGTQNVIETAIEEDVKTFITVSTDKAVSPNNVMGATKLLAERLTLAADLYKGNRQTVFSVVRFGNVLNSRGSLLPSLRKQVLEDKRIQVTDERMTRFVMRIEHAAGLVLKVVEIAKGGEIFVLRMPAVNVIDLIDVATEEVARSEGIALKDVKRVTIGARKGEKLSEALMTEDEISAATLLDEILIIKPDGKRAKKAGFDTAELDSESAKKLSKEQIRKLLKDIDYPGCV
jgi:UDP-N-acetylglucosamine 4,6-dehydratase